MHACMYVCMYVYIHTYIHSERLLREQSRENFIGLPGTEVHLLRRGLLHGRGRLRQ